MVLGQKFIVEIISNFVAATQHGAVVLWGVYHHVDGDCFLMIGGGVPMFSEEELEGFCHAAPLGGVFPNCAKNTWIRATKLGGFLHGVVRGGVRSLSG